LATLTHPDQIVNREHPNFAISINA
jgi:hypothetical protein